MASFDKRVFDDGHHRVVAFRIEHFAGADENLYLVGLVARLVEALGQVVQIEGDEVEDALSAMRMRWPLLTSNAAPEFFATTRRESTAETTVSIPPAAAIQRQWRFR